MNTEEKTLSNLKHFMVYNTINSTDNKKLYNKMDELLIRKRFSNIGELSYFENVFRIDMLLITDKDTLNIVSDFLKVYKNKNIFSKRELYEIFKISNLEEGKLEKLFNDAKFLKLYKGLEVVSRETLFISFDFLILRIFDNFIRKLSGKESFFDDIVRIKENIIKKIQSFEYKYDDKEKETNSLCWIDRILSGVIDREFSVDDFIDICNKIILTTTHTIYIYWKILNSAGYLLLQREFSASMKLRAYKTHINKIIERKYTLLNISKDELNNLAISTLAKDFPIKEDFYYLFDCISILSKKSQENKEFCLDLCDYILYYDTRYNIFSYRFIRKYFIEMLFDITNQFDNISIKNKEILLLIKLFHTDQFYSFYKKDIFNHIATILKNMNNKTNKLTQSNFYKYCDMLDYLMYANSDLANIDIIDYLCNNNDNTKKISKHFQLQKILT
ncbi:MAG: hypothetical protein IKW58_03665 [Alphaproteobacteria bacterium]|nr:hypothetical protein [Alphaproteobacteria bacterium]